MNIPPTESMNNMNGESMSKDSIFVEDVPSQINMESSDPYVSNVDLEKDKKTGLRLYPKLFFDSSLSFTAADMRMAMREDIEIDRSAMKLAKIWKKRGLAVDQKTLHSVSKDAFDMRALNESLPSTSEKKQDCIGFRRQWHQNSEFDWKPKFWMRKNVRRSERTSSITSQLGKLLDATPSANIDASASVVRGRVQSCLMRSLRKTPASDEQKKRNEDEHISFREKFLGIWEGQDAPSCLDGQKISLGSTITYKPDDNDLKEKSSGVEKNLQNVEFPPLLNPIWDSERNWNRGDLLSPCLCVPLNSPTKWKDDVFERSRSLPSMAKFLSEIHHSRLKVCREESKLRKLNSHRGVFSEDMDGSECESPSSKQASSSSHDAVTNLRKALREARRSLNSAKDQIGFSGNNRQTMRQLMRVRKRLSSENNRSIECYLPSGKVNSDKVLPD